MNKKVAVLLAAYNGMEWIKEQIDSILCQIDVDVVIYISVDVSIDGTYEYCLSLSRDYPNICVLPYGYRFGSAGKNFYRLLNDCDVSDFDYVAFSDQDDIWYADKLSKAISWLHDYDCYSSNVTAFWSDGNEILIDKAQPQREFDFLFEAAGPGCTYVFKRDLISTFKNWLSFHYEEVLRRVELHDWFLYAFARSNGYRWYIDDKPSMRYRQHDKNQVGANHSFAAARKRLHLIRVGWYRQQVQYISSLLGLNDVPLVKRGILGGYQGNLILLTEIGKLRRRGRDRLALLVALILNFF